jgi:predicted NBD/HSP70 family sugar kinase
VFALNSSARLIVGIDLGATHCRVGITDLRLNVIAEHQEEAAVEDGPTIVLDRACTMITDLVGSLGRSISDIAGIGVGIPGFVDPGTERPANSPLIPGWDGFDVVGYIQSRVGPMTVILGHDVDLMAIGEHRLAFPDVPNFLFVKVGTGIGAGIILDGELRQGAQGGAGSLGHIAVPGRESVPCRCGNFGCLEAVASTRAVVETFFRDEPSRGSAAQIAALAQAGDLRATAALRDAGRDLGQVLTACVLILNPSVIVVGSDLVGADEHLLAGVREVVYTRALPTATARLSVVATQVGAQLGILGAATVVADRLFTRGGYQLLEWSASGDPRRDTQPATG